MKIINMGSLNVDYVYRTESIVKPGETISSRSLETFAGGKGLNQSIAIAKAGGQVVHAGFYGQDGDFLYKTLKDNGVNVSLLEKSDSPNGHAIIQVDDQGENSIILYAGTNALIDERYIDQLASSIEPEDIVLFQNETSSIAYAMRKAKEKGARIAFNPAPMNGKALTYPIDLVDILIVNQSEGQALSGQQLPMEIIEELSSMYPKAKIVLTLGGDGCIFTDGNDTISVEAGQVDSVVDTTAAGDTFIGYYLVHHDELGHLKALELAAKAAAMAIAVMGAAVSIPLFEDISK